MPSEIKKKSKIIVVEGPLKGSEGIVTMVRRVYDADTKTMRWTVWADGLDGGPHFKTRLSWVREIEA